MNGMMTQYDTADILDVMEELVYISDIETYDLLYVNKSLQNTLPPGKIQGHKCYQLLQGRTSPCPFCTNSQLTDHAFYQWDFYNPVFQKHFRLRDKLLHYQDRPARIEIATDITDQVYRQQDLDLALSTERALAHAIGLLRSSDNIERSLPILLKTIGEFLQADRAYIFKFYEDKISNTHEWCRPGVSPQIDNLQHMDIELIHRWMPYFLDHDIVCIKDLEHIRESDPEEYTILAAQDIHSYAVAPLEVNHKLIGFIGIDNPPVPRMENIGIFMLTLAHFLSSSIENSENHEMLAFMSYSDSMTGVLNRNAYIRDIEHYETQETAHANVPVGVVFFDLNGLKRINDLQGHRAGDEALIALTETISRYFRKNEIYRIGGDEFVVLSFDTPQEIFNDRVSALENHFKTKTSLSVSIGKIWYPANLHLQDIIAQADQAMYRKKKEYYKYRG